MIVTDLTPEHIQEFWGLVNKQKPDECWAWLGHYSPYGYAPIIDIDGRRFIAYRIAYYLHTGIDPRDHIVNVNCGCMGCCNPAHIYMGGPMPGWDAKKRGLIEYL